MRALRYWVKAFAARPMGMPIPPNFFYLAAVGLLGAFVSPGFVAVGLGGELLYLWALANNPRFRAQVDAEDEKENPSDQRYTQMMGRLDSEQRRRQHAIEGRAREIFATMAGSPLLNTHRESLEQLVWLHLRLLAARQALVGVVASAREERAKLDAQEREIEKRLERTDLGPDLRRSLEQQKVVIDQRQEAHASAGQRLEHVDSEIARIEQQIALIREQALLSTNDENVGASLDALAASFNEANRWLGSQRDLLGPLDLDLAPKLPQRVLQGPPPTPRGRDAVSQ